MVLPEINNTSTTINVDNIKTGVIAENNICDNSGNKFVTLRDLEYYHNKLMKEYHHRENKNFTCMFDGEC